MEEALRYDEDQIRNVVRFAFRLAESRSGLLHNIHKRNILESSVLWNEIVEEEAPHFPAVHVHHMLVDAAATHLCLNPSQFDVMVMENLFGALTQGLVLDDELKRSIGRALRSQLSPRHVPDQIEQVPSVPRTLSGKKLEVPVKRILGGASPTAVASRSSLADQSSLDWFETYAAQAQASKSA